MSHKTAHKKVQKHRRLGEILVERGLITEITLKRSLERSRQQNSKLGKLLEDIGLITGDELADALACQYGVRVVRDFARYRYAPELLALVPAETARRYDIFPLKKDAGRLAVAIADLGDISIAADLAAEQRLQLVPFVASEGDIRTAIERHYVNAEAVQEPQKPKTILLAEDDRLTYTILQGMLTKKGYRVLLEKNGMDAYRTIQKEQPDIVLTDKVMPMMDGYELLSSLRAHPETKNIPVIMISASDNRNEEANAFERGFFDYLSKPVREATLLVRVERALAFAEK